MMGMVLAVLAGCGQEKPTEYEGWELVWHDEFDKDGVKAPDSWIFEEGFVRNKELLWYQSQSAEC